MIGYEARCQKCGETFNPAHEKDLEHGQREDEQECGGQGVLLGGWISPRTYRSDRLGRRVTIPED